MSEPTAEGEELASGSAGRRALVFDSGMGGLTVAAALKARAPALGIDYAADTGFFPYGDKSDEALRKRLPEITARLVEAARPDVLVVACNTASTLALDEMRAALPVPVVGTVPAIKPAAALSKTGTIAMLATPGTVRRAYTAALIREFAAELRVIQHGSVELVRLAEASAAGEDCPIEAIARAQAPVFEAEGGSEIDVVVLACTHFPLLRSELAASAPHAVTYIDSGDAIARQTLRVLSDNAAAPVRSAGPSGRLFTTSPPAAHPRLVKTAARFGFPDVCALDEVRVTGSI